MLRLIYAFMCASTHSVHLEFTRGRSVDAFIKAFRKLVGNRGCQFDNPKYFSHLPKKYSDFVIHQRCFGTYQISVPQGS